MQQHHLQRRGGFGWRKALAAVVFALCLGGAAAQATEVVQRDIPQAKMIGQGVLSFAFWDIYEATLYAAGSRWQADRPFALSIEYYVDTSGATIAEKSTEEIRRQRRPPAPTLIAWDRQMHEIFPDVTKGTVLTAVYLPRSGTTFYKNSDRLGVIAGDGFARAFFGIWLDETTAAPDLRRALLGLGQ